MSNLTSQIKKEEKSDLKVLTKVENLQVKQADQSASTSKRKRESPELKLEEFPDSKKANTGVQDDDDENEEKVIPMNRDSFFYCRRCNINIKGCREYYGHLKSVHKITPNTKGVKFIDLQPDIDDPNFYCRSCERSHDDRNLFNTHLRRVHHMLLKPIAKPKKVDVLPDPKNPENYCTVCKKKYSKPSFKRHLFLAHKMDLKLEPTKP